LAAAVIVEDDVDDVGRGVARDLPRTRGPRPQLLGLVEVVVARTARVLAPPVAVVAPVHAHVTDARRAPRRGPDGPAEQRLVDVDEPDATLAEPRVEPRIVPALVPHLDDERVLAERLHQVREPLAVRIVVLERPGELDQDSAELSRLVERVEPVAHTADLAERPCFGALVREAAPQFGRVAEMVQVAYARGPLLR